MQITGSRDPDLLLDHGRVLTTLKKTFITGENRYFHRFRADGAYIAQDKIFIGQASMNDICTLSDSIKIVCITVYGL